MMILEHEPSRRSAGLSDIRVELHLDFAEAQRSMRLFAAEVMPVFATGKAQPARAAQAR